jgi:hypothetical protein
MQFSVTGVFTAAALYLLICRPNDTAGSNWAIGILGLIAGYWLK